MRIRRRDFIAGLGSAAAWPIAARAQQPTMPVIGYLSGVSETETQLLPAAFRQGLSEMGYVEGRNLQILYRSAEGRYERLPELAADLVNHRVSMIFASLVALASLAAKSATPTIPIVFAHGADPVALGLVASLSRPGGNVTGVNFLVIGLVPKRLEMLHQIAPPAMPIGFLINPTNSTAETQIKEAQAAANVLGVRLITLNASNPNEIEAAFGAVVAQHMGALMEGSDAFFSISAIRLQG